jgi:hypothetical protein
MTKTEEKFVKIITLDAWGSKGYYLKAKKSAAGTWGHEGQDQSFRLKNGDKLEVRWPDGTLTQTRVRIAEVTETVFDHGHEYPTRSENLYLRSEMKGTKVDLDTRDLLSKIRVRRARR